jgi:hypothetical protein
MPRTFGFEAGNREVRQSEADTVRRAVQRLLSDETATLGSVVAWLNQTGQLTSTGRPWEVSSLKRTLTSPAMAGLKQVDGHLEPDDAPAIITPEERQALVVRLSGRRQAPPQRYLLTGGLGKCALSGTPLVAGRSYRGGSGLRSYVCPPPSEQRPSRRGCGRIRCLAEPLEDHVAAMALARLASPESAAAVAEAIAADEQRAAELRADVADARERLAVLARDFAYGSSSAADIRPSREYLQRKIRDGEEQLRRIRLLNTAPIHDQEHLAAAAPTRKVTGRNVNVAPKRLADWWHTASIDQQRALLAVLIREVRVGPVRLRGAKAFDADRVKIIWR